MTATATDNTTFIARYLQALSGKAKTPAIVSALQSSDPLKALLRLGEPKFHERLLVLRREITALTNEGTFGGLKYSVATGDFIAG